MIHAYSEVIHPTIGKKLMDLAGQSSLSMKPSLSILLSGSCLFLALEGTSHSILRLKSILQQPSSNTSNFSHSIGSSQVILIIFILIIILLLLLFYKILIVVK